MGMGNLKWVKILIEASVTVRIDSGEDGVNTAGANTCGLYIGKKIEYI